MKNSPDNLQERPSAAGQQARPPIVAVLGHVDHGKSTLLDFIRTSNTVQSEAGGITQHVAAYEVTHVHEGAPRRITFIDTPGHAAFQAIRARGARAADIAILVVAADDGVKAQTLEALHSIQDAGIPFIVAINKIDKPNADVSRTQSSLLEHGVYLEKMGGDVPWAAVSAKTGAGVPELLDLILLVAEMQELRGNAAANAEGFVIEAHRDQRRGIAATLIITNGTLTKGETILAGTAIAPSRIMENDSGAALQKASFSAPISVVGFDALPEVGVVFRAFSSKRAAENARGKLVQEGRPQTGADTSAEANEKFNLPVIIRADTTGSLEAIEHEAATIGDEHAGIQIIQSGVGDISENDIKSAIASGACAVIGFNVHSDRLAEALARQNNVQFETFDIIYKLTERLTELLKESAPRRTIEEVVGHAKIMKVFSSRKDEHLVGGKVADGALTKNGVVRVMRRGEEAGRGKILSIQANRQIVQKVGHPNEFGAQIEAPFEFLPGDTLECILVTTV